MTPEELQKIKARADADDPAALYEYSVAIRPVDPKEADKFVILAAQLGQPQANEAMGDILLSRGNYDGAASCFKTGAKAGLLDCSVKLAAMNLSVNESAALKELEDLAEIGVRSACIALSEYYLQKGNRKQYAYWRSLLK